MTTAERELSRLKETEAELKQRIKQMEAQVLYEKSRSPDRSSRGHSALHISDGGSPTPTRDPVVERELGFDPSPRRKETVNPSTQYPEAFTGRVLCRDSYGSISPRRVEPDFYEGLTASPSRDPFTRKQTRAGLWDQGKGSKGGVQKPLVPSPHRRSYRSYGDSERAVPPPFT
eukprot:TRINITY_DN11665_c0_g1_i2.p1 TRINITY_DN11665_c0_g1~~TRINITY_DN11665_c0_g1_i2.p1  ORF type:complete len:173 (+),score=19.54 TRINITY_DN11665_c0_g1_i2:41-559(+)